MKFIKALSILLVASSISSCDLFEPTDPVTTDTHVCEHVCETCGKCKDLTCSNEVCKNKCSCEDPTVHKCQHKCPGCGRCMDPSCTDSACANKCEFIPIDPDLSIECTVDVHSILTGTPFETPVYTYTSNIEGPRCAIIGGIHGDEVAGWNAASQMLERKDFRGTVLIIPYANYVADMLDQRYPGVGKEVTQTQVNNLLKLDDFKDRDLSSLVGKKFADLNRAFPGKSTGSNTQKIADAVFQEVLNFAPDAVVDLHESMYSHYQTKSTDDAKYLGNLVIYGNTNSSMTAWELTDEFNAKYRKTGEEDFEYFEGLVEGSFCRTMGETLPEDTIVYTFETIRNSGKPGNSKGFSKSRRIEQQKQLIDLFLLQAYAKYAAKK